MKKFRNYACSLLIVLMAFMILFPAKAQAKSKSKKAYVKTNLSQTVKYTDKQYLKLSIKNKKYGYVIRYTTNGKTPTYRSAKYKKAITLTKTTIFKVKIFKGKKAISSTKTIRINFRETWKMTQYKDASGLQAMFYTLKSNEGRLIVIDGGWKSNESYVRKVIAGLGNVVDAWILTHPHPDHIGAFNQIYRNPQGIQIKKIYDTPLDYTTYKSKSTETDQIEVYEEYLSLTRGDSRIVHLAMGNNFNIGSFNIQVLSAFNAYVTKFSDTTSNICNDSSLVLKCTVLNDTVLFTGDIQNANLLRFLIQKWGAKLKAKYMQATHHGNWGAELSFYQYVNPKIVTFDAPLWLVTGAQYTAKTLMNNLKSMGVTIYDYQTAPNSFILR